MTRSGQPALFPEALGSEVLPKEKTSFSLSAEAKFKLATLKANLRRRGYPATESGIVEALIERASSDQLLVEAVGAAQSPARSRRQTG
jgi:hypothetical protein